jgi:hypothetical protein
MAFPASAAGQAAALEVTETAGLRDDTLISGRNHQSTVAIGCQGIDDEN